MTAIALCLTGALILSACIIFCGLVFSVFFWHVLEAERKKEEWSSVSKSFTKGIETLAESAKRFEEKSDKVMDKFVGKEGVQ